ncbi:hypothetical protein PS1_046964 [Malus domestica]
MMHDFAITERHIVILDQQVVFKLQEMIGGGSPVIYDKNKMSRFGILDKNAKDASGIQWVDCPDCFCFHLWNAWEEPETDEIVVIGSCMTPPDSIFNECDENLESILSEIRLNLKTGKSTRHRICAENLNLEAGMVDLSTGEVKKHIYGEEKYGREPLFLPRDPNSEDEDDGSPVTGSRFSPPPLQVTTKVVVSAPGGFHPQGPQSDQVVVIWVRPLNRPKGHVRV